VKATEFVTLARLESDFFKDGVRFANGVQVTLQRLGPGAKASVEDALLAPQKVRKTVLAIEGRLSLKEGVFAETGRALLLRMGDRMIATGP
jgi:hypothetical protein